MNVVAVVLAAGKGVRMKSDLPKVFLPLRGKPMLSYVLDTVLRIEAQKVYVVVGHKADLIKDYFKDYPVTFVEQREQLGTGHAVLQVEPLLGDFDGTVLVIPGDTPLVSRKTIVELLNMHNEANADATVLTANLSNPGNLGRIIRNGGEIERIVEVRDATEEELALREVNTGTYCFKANALFSALAEVSPSNAQKEYYLTDTISILKRKGLKVIALRAKDSQEALGVNTKEELIRIEEIMRKRHDFN